MTKKHYEILGINEGASTEEIKKAYKQKAKQLHPDHNPSPFAHEEFILLNEACMYLLRAKEYNSTNRHSTQKQDYVQTSQDYARAQAQRFARTRYEEYIHSKYYKDLIKINEYSDLVSSILIIAIINTLVLTISASRVDRLTDISLSIQLCMFVFSGIVTAFLFKFIDFKKISKFNSDISQFSWFCIGTSFTYNIFAFLSLGLRVWIPSFSLIFIYALGIFLFYLIYRYRFSGIFSIKKIIYPLTYGILPISILLYVNAYMDDNYTYLKKSYFLLSEKGTNEYRNEFDKYPFIKFEIEHETANNYGAFNEYGFSSFYFKKGKLGIPVYSHQMSWHYKDTDQIPDANK